MPADDGPTPKQALNAVTSVLSPHIAQLLEQRKSYPELEHDSLPTVASLLTSSLLQCEQSIHSHSLSSSLPSPAELRSLSLSLSSSLTALHALSQQQDDVEAALSLYFAIAEAVALLSLLLSSVEASAFPSDSSSLSVFRSVLTAWQQAYPSTSSARGSGAMVREQEALLPGAILTAEIDAATIVRRARSTLSSQFLTLLQQLSQPAAEGEEEAGNDQQAELRCFQTLSHIIHPSSLAAHFCSFVSSRYSLREQPALLRPLTPAASQPELSAAWAASTERIVSAFQQQLPVLSEAILPSLPSPSSLPPLLQEAFVSPFLSLCARFLQLHEHSLAAYAFLLPQLSGLSSQLSTLASTFFSVTMPAARLPSPLPPQTLLACISASLPETKADAQTRKATAMETSGGLVREDVLQCVRVCDTMVEVMGAVEAEESSRAIPELSNLLRQQLLGWTERSVTEQQQAGLRSLLLGLSSLAGVLQRWSQYQQTLMRISRTVTSELTQQPPLPSSLTSSSFSSQLQLLLRSQAPASSALSAPQRRLPTLSLVTGAQTEKERARLTAAAPAGWAEVENEMRALILTTLRGCEAEMTDCLQIIAEGWTAIDWPRKRDWPASMRPALTGPSAPIRHLSFFLCSTRQYLSSILPSSCSAASSYLMLQCLHQAALLSLSLLTSACPSRYQLPQYRLDLVATILLLSSHLRLQQKQTEMEESRALQLAAVVAWLVLSLGVLEAEPELVETAIREEESEQAAAAAEQDAIAVKAVLGAWEEATAGNRPDTAVEMGRISSWAAVEWSAAWQEAGGCRCHWAAVLTARHAVCIARVLEFPALRLRSWASKRFDMQANDFPALTEEQDRRAQPLRKLLSSSNSRQPAHDMTQ